MDPRRDQNDDNEDIIDDEDDGMDVDVRINGPVEEDESDDEDDSEADEGDSDTDSGDDLGGDSDEDSEGSADVKRRKKPTKEERFAELTAKRKKAEKEAFDAEMRAMAAERERDEFRARLAEREKAAAPTEPKAEDFIYGSMDPLYQEALVEFRVQKRLAESQTEAGVESKGKTEAERNAHYQTRLQTVAEEGKKRHKDFEEAVGSTNFDAHLARLVLDSDKAVDIAYYLSQNISVLREATLAAPEQRARIIGRLEGKFSATSAGRKTTQAPDPLRGRGSSPRRETDEDVKYGPSRQDDFDEAFFKGR